MNLGRRIVLSLTLAAGLAVIARTTSSILIDTSDGGWFMYAPDSTVPFESGASDGDRLATAAIWLAAIGAWSAVSWHLFRNRNR